jgi:hypothetical protein
VSKLKKKNPTTNGVVCASITGSRLGRVEMAMISAKTTNSPRPQRKALSTSE